MPYELYQRSAVRVDSPTVAIAPGGRIIVNAAGCRILKGAGVKYAVLLWDHSARKMAIKAAARGRDAFSITFVREGSSGSLHAAGFVRSIGWNATRRENLPAAWNEREKMFEVDLPARHLASSDDSKRKAKVL
jgi:hypothetical protein